MDLAFSEEQRLLADTAARFAMQRGGFDKRRELSSGSRQCWQELAALGWLGLVAPSAYGGLDLGAIEVGIVAEAMGRGLLREPALSVAGAASLVAKLGTEAQQAALLPSICSGTSIATIAHAERDSYARLDQKIRTTARRTIDGWIIRGEKSHVIGGPWFDILLVSALFSDGSEQAEKLMLFAVPVDTPGIRRIEIPTVDGSLLADIVLDDVKLPVDAMLGDGADATAAIECVFDLIVAGLASEAAGCADVLLSETIKYTKSRVQFGKPLASHQVIKHRIAEMAIRVEEMRASALNAALYADAAPAQRSRAASGAKAKVAACGRYIAEQAVQLHGGMGVTDELNVGAYFKRLLAIEFLYGDEQFHLHRYAAIVSHSDSGE